MLGLLLFIIYIYHGDASDAAQGSTIILSCSFSGPVTSLRWLKSTPTVWIELTNDMKYDNAKKLNITIRNVDVTDSREYLCQSGNDFVKIQLNVVVYATQGSTVVWECPFSASNYTWQKFIQGSWTQLSDNGKYSNALTSLITIRNVEVNDSGQYRCYVHNAWDSIFLYVIVIPPIVNMSDQSYLAIIGENVTLDCMVSGYSAAPVIWWTDGQGTRLNGTRYSGGTLLNPSLTIQNVTESDSGQYTCHAINAGGANNQTTQLEAGYKPLVKSLEENAQATVGGNIILQCSFDSNPKPISVFWVKDGNILNVSDSAKYNGGTVKTPSLTIYNVNNSDSGKYACTVENRLGSSLGKAIKLVVQEPSKSAILVGPIAGGVSGSIVAVGLVVVALFLYFKRNWATGAQNHDYDTRDNTKFDLHLYDETQGSISIDNTSPAYVDPSKEQISSENDMYRTFTMYDVRDLMRVLQNESSLSRHVRNEYQALKSKPISNATCNYEIAVIKSGTISFEEYSNKALIKQQDNGYGYIITTVTDQSDNDNFWTMITNYHVGCIILLLHEMEKIFAFFPNTDEPIDTHKFKVEVSFFDKFQTNILEFVLDIWNKEKKTVVKVKLYKITDWKMGDEHPSIDTMCKLLNILSSNNSDMVTLLGSNDIGFRVCGELAACHEVLHAINNKKVFNLLQIAVDLKNIRPDLFQTCEEYNLCYKVIGYFLQNEHTYEVIDKKI